MHVQQAFDLPTLQLDIDRTRAQSVGLIGPRRRAERAGLAELELPDGAVLLARSRRNGVSYSVAVQTPQYRMDSLQALGNTPVSGAGGAGARRRCSATS